MVKRIDPIKPDNVVYKATFMPPLMLNKRLFIFDKLISSIVDSELSINMNPITVPTIPSFNKRSEIKKPSSTIS